MGHYQVGSSRLYPPHLPRAAHVAPSPTPDLCLGLFCPGNCLVGLPFLVRTVLGLSATHYGILESILAFASIVGSILAGLLTNRLSTERLFLPLLLLGAVLFPVGFAFLLPLGAPGRYGVLLAASAILQIAATVFSVFALSLLQGMRRQHAGQSDGISQSPFLSVPNHWARFLYGALFDTFPFQTAGIFFRQWTLHSSLGRIFQRSISPAVQS